VTPIDDNSKRASFRELTGKALSILATEPDDLRRRLELARTELMLAHRYRAAIPQELQLPFDSLLEGLASDLQGTPDGQTMRERAAEIVSFAMEVDRAAHAGDRAIADGSAV
jgi:hypothetical protein